MNTQDTVGTYQTGAAALFAATARLPETTKTLRVRRDQILQAIGDREVEPTNELLEELAEINALLGEAFFDES